MANRLPLDELARRREALSIPPPSTTRHPSCSLGEPFHQSHDAPAVVPVREDGVRGRYDATVPHLVHDRERVLHVVLRNSHPGGTFGCVDESNLAGSGCGFSQGTSTSTVVGSVSKSCKGIVAKSPEAPY